jgi:hypothetical protein
VQDVRLVPLVRVDDVFSARVLVARLGSEGIVTSLRGAVDGPYPVGPVTVLVAESDLALAREVLLVEEVESSFSTPGAELTDEEEAWPATSGPAWALVFVLVFMVLFTLGRLFVL